MVKKEDVEMLLPWYLTGKLAPAEHDQVEAYLAAHPDMGEQLKLIKEDSDATILANEALGAPAPGALEQLLASIEREKPVAAASARQNILAGIFEKIGEAFALPTVRYAGIAAVLLIMLQAATIGTLLNKTSSLSGFQTASGPEKILGLKGTRVLVTFAATAKAGDITKLLSGLDAVIVSGPKAGGVYEIRLSDKAMQADKVEKILDDLRNQANVIAFAARAE